MISKLFRRVRFRLRSAEKWNAVRSYNELHGLLSDYGLPASPGEFASGPLRRFFDLSLAPGLSDGQRVRNLEHARHWARKARAHFKDTALSVAIDAEMAQLTAMGAIGRWAVEVFEGDATHHAAPPFPDQG